MRLPAIDEFHLRIDLTLLYDGKYHNTQAGTQVHIPEFDPFFLDITLRRIKDMKV